MKIIHECCQLGKTSMSHYVFENFRKYEDLEPICWAYLLFARWYNDEIKW